MLTKEGIVGYPQDVPTNGKNSLSTRINFTDGYIEVKETSAKYLEKTKKSIVIISRTPPGTETIYRRVDKIKNPRPPKTIK